MLQTTVYSLMIKFEGEIDRNAKRVTIPPTATQICEVACFFGSITSLDLESTNVIIIEKHAFANCCNLKKVRFPSCLEEICEGAFKNCPNLRLISFPMDSRLRIIGNKAFFHCLMLSSIEFPPHLEFIGDCSFKGCEKVKIFDFRETQAQHVGRISYCDCTFYLPPTVMYYDVIKISEESYNCQIEVDESHRVVQRDSCGYFFSNGTIFHGNKKSRRVLIHRGVERIAGRCFYRSINVSVTIPSSVTEINDKAFSGCYFLQQILFNKDSLLRVIEEDTFACCSSIKDIHFPRSLKIIKEGAFEFCESLERVVFPQDSQLERIEGAFGETAIKRLSLPPSVREIVDVSYRMWKLESMFVSNEYYQSNEEGSAIFSKDGSELVCVIKTLEQFEIPGSVCVIKKRAFYDSSITSLIIPPSVEIIEEKSFNNSAYLKIVKFQSGSRLKSLAFDAFDEFNDLIINNENFVKMKNGVVMSMNPRGIVFVPRSLAELEIPPGVEVIYSNAFYRSKIKSLKLPKILKKICYLAFAFSSLESVTLEEGTELDFIGSGAFQCYNTKRLKIPHINGEFEAHFLDFRHDIIEFPSKLNLKNKEMEIYAAKILCPRLILSTLAHFDFNDNSELLIED